MKAFINYLKRLLLTSKKREAIFRRIAETNYWGDTESKSGAGSNIQTTQILIPAIQKIIQDFDIKTILDAPCGDFNWMKHVVDERVSYHGVDIVSSLILENKKKYNNTNVKFSKLDLVSDSFARYDLVICRDCFVHFSIADIKKALNNIVASETKYLLTTTFPNVNENIDIFTGKWRAINLEITPFNLKEVVFRIEEVRDPVNPQLVKQLVLFKLK